MTDHNYQISRKASCSLRSVIASLLLSAVAFAQESTVPVQSGCEVDYPPLCIVHEDGRSDGFSVELMRAVLAKMGREVTFRTGPCEEVRGWLQRGEIDCLPLVGRTPEREALFDFTVPYLTMHGAIVVRKDAMGIHSLADLRDRRVGVMKGDKAEEFLRRKDRGIEIVTAPTFSAALDALADERIDAVIMQRLVALRLLAENKRQNLLKLVDKPIPEFKQEFCFAVTEGDRETLALLNEGLAICMADGTHRRLHGKWFAHLQLPTDRPIVVGGDHNYPPFEFLDEQGRPAGYNVDLIRTVAEAAGLEIRVRLGPWSEMMDALDRGEIDAMQGMFYSPERDQTFDFSQAHVVNHCVSVVRADAGKPPASVDDLKGKRIVVQDGDIMHDFCIEHGLTDRLVAVDAQEDALRELAAGEHDCALMTRMTAFYWVEQEGWDNLVIGQTPLASPEYCFAVPEGDRALLAQLSEGLTAVADSGEYHRIHEKWMGVYGDHFLWDDVLKHVAMVAVPLLGVALLALLWSWSLRRQVAARTRELQEKETFVRKVLDNLPVGVAVNSVDPAVPQYMNDLFPHIYRTTQEALSDPDTFWDVVYEDAEFRETMRARVEADCASGDPARMVWEDVPVSREGEPTTYISARNTPIKGTQLMISSVSDVTERKRREEELATQFRLLRVAGETARFGGWSVDLETRTVTWSDLVCDIHGVPHGYSPKVEDGIAFYAPEWREKITEVFTACVEDGVAYDEEMQIMAADGRRVWVRTAGQPIKDERGKIVKVEGAFQDISERKRHENRLQHLLQVLRAVRNVNQLITHEKTQDTLLRQACDILTETRGYHSAWIGLLSDGDGLEPVAESGIGDAFSSFAEQTKSGDLPECCRRALESEGTVVMHTMQENCKSCPLTCTYRDTAALAHALGHEDREYGVIVVAVPVETADDEQEQSLFAELAGDISYALFSIESEQKREEADAALRRFEWLTEKEEPKAAPPPPVYGDVCDLNTERLILDSVGPDTLRTMATDVMDLLDTSIAIYESNGDYAFGMFVSEWCGLMDSASRALCCTESNAEALQCGKWLCHENCWNDSARTAMAAGEPTDIACVGGIRLYAVPIRAGGETIGAINLGYGNPPTDEEVLTELATTFGLDVDTVRAAAHAYKPRPPFIIDVAKRRVASIARTVGEIVERKQADEALREAKATLEAAMDNSTAGIAIAGAPDGKLRYVNQAGLLIRGGTEEEAVRDVDVDQYVASWHLLDLDGEPLARDEVPLARAILYGETCSREFMIRREEHDDRVVLANAAPIRNDAGDVTAGIVVFLDVTETKQAEASLREAEARFRAVVETIPDLVWLKDVDGCYLACNPRFEAFVGASEEEILGKTDHDFVPADLADFFRENDRKAMDRGEATRNEEWITFASDGHQELLETIKTPMVDEAGTVTGVLGIGRDITDRKRVEEEAWRRRAYLERIFEVLPIGLWFADKDGTLLRGNPAGVRIWGAEPHVSPSEYGVFKAWRLPSRAPVRPEDWALAKTIRDGVTVVDELLEIEAFDDTRKTILNYTAPILDEQGEIEGAIVINLDITDRAALEAQLRQAQKMESVGRLAGGVAHDYNNIVMGILNYAELCRDDLDADHPARQWIDEITKEAQRSADLTRQLLAFARKQTIAPQVVDLNDAVGNMLTMLRRLIGEDIDLAWEPGGGLWQVHIDPGQIDQILANLCVNARDAIEGTGKVTIETENVTLDEAYCAEHEGFKPGDFAMLAVSDDGRGMDRETLEHIFEPFYTTKGQGEGTGLGLATVYGIVKQNDGFVNVYSEPGKGTTFRIYLPRFEGGERTRADREEETEIIGGSETILLVEDEKSIRLTMRLFLEKLGYTVLAAEKPEKARTLLSNHAGTIDLLITDVVMPGMSGRELAESLTSDYPALRVLYMSGYTANVIAHRGVLEEGVQFLSKPITHDQLAQKVRAMLG